MARGAGDTTAVFDGGGKIFFATGVRAINRAWGGAEAGEEQCYARPLLIAPMALP